MFISKNKIKGFTLIELLVVVAIIGLLSSVVVASLTSANIKSRDTKRLSSLKQIQAALELYHNDNNSYPTLLAYLNTSSGDVNWSTGFATALSSYIPELPNDATTNGYIYSSTNSGQKYGLGVGFEGSNFDDLMTGDGGFYNSYYEIGPSPADCKGVGKDWWGSTTKNCP